MTKAPRIAALDAGRTLAVLGVIAVHLAPWMATSPVWLDSLANLGQYGVQCFFVISAITIAASIEHDARRLRGRRDVLFNFYVKRFVRIAPLYYLAILGYSGIEYILHLAHGHIQQPHDFSDVVLNVLFLHSWVASATDSVVPGGWSIGVEMFFYAFAPALVLFCRTTRGLMAVSLVTAAFSAACWYFIACDGSACRIVNNEFYYFWVPTQLPCFIVGFWAWHLGKRFLVGDARLSRRSFALMGALSLTMVVAVYALGTGLGLSHVLAPTAAALATAGLMLMLTRFPQDLLRARTVVVLGRNSFGIYVWHFIAILVVRAVMRIDAIDDFAEYHAIVVFAVSMVATIAMAYGGALFTARHVEEPCSRWAMGWLGRVAREGRAAGARGGAAEVSE
jgi:peptidoglycan/LPS O-acetylase OafA/YrhL